MGRLHEPITGDRAGKIEVLEALPIPCIRSAKRSTTSEKSLTAKESQVTALETKKG
jgi:hypothetical protein